MSRNLLVTPANVARISGNITIATCGEACDAGDALARNTVDGLYYKASCDAAESSQRQKFDALALGSALAANRPIVALVPYNNAVVDIGTPSGSGTETYTDVQDPPICYVVSRDRGKIMRNTELAATDWVIAVGWGSEVNDNYLVLNSAVPGVQAS